MKIPSCLWNMARYLSRKIFKNPFPQTRLFTNRLELIPQSNRIAAPDGLPDNLTEETGGQSIRYNVCRERGGNKKFVFEKKPKLPSEPEVEEQHIEPQLESVEITQHQACQHKGYRNFSVSTTQKNTILPLKLSKLAKPFPDPVKVMPSHTVSDQDKADQAQAEFRVPRSITRKTRI